MRPRSEWIPPIAPLISGDPQLPLQVGMQADTTPKVVDEVDFAASCGPTVQQTFR
jgi:hypothetical protein